MVVRDPGQVDATKAQTVEDASMPTDQPDRPQPEEGEELSLFDVLMPPGSAKDDENWMGNGGRRWCKVVRRSFSMTSPRLSLITPHSAGLLNLHDVITVPSVDGAR